MNLVNKIIILCILGSFTLLEAFSQSQKMILESSKNKEQILIKLSQAKKLSQEYNLSYTLEKFGDYFVISISPIETIRLQEALFVLFRADFPTLFYVNESENSVQIKNIDPKQTTLLLESLEKVDKGEIIQYLKNLHLWIEKWYILLILFILGLYFYYRKVKELSEIRIMQNSFERKQDQVNL